MNRQITFTSPKTVHFGYESLLEIKAEASKLGNKAFIITDKVMNEVGHVAKCEQLLHEARIDFYVYTGVASEPKDKYVFEALALFQESNADFIISIGGGSCIDTAKAVTVLATNDISLPQLIEQNIPLIHTPIAHIAIPTTAGTGSEVTDVTVITDTTEDVKMMLKNTSFIPSLAIVDPQFTESCPDHVVAGTGVDALCHAVEAYISKKSHKMTDTYALAAIDLIMNNLEVAYHNHADSDAKAAMSLGSLYAGLAFSNASVCLVHGMSRPLGAMFDIPHGLSNAMLLPTVLQFSKDACLEEMATIGRVFNSEMAELDVEPLANDALDRITSLNKALQVPTLQEWGIDRNVFLQHVDKMIEDAMASGSPANNPIVPTKEEMQQLYVTCYDNE